MEAQGTSPKGKKVGTIIKWIAGVVFILTGLGGFEKSFIAGLFLLVAGVLILPVVSSKLKEKFPLWNNKVIRRGISVVLILIGGMIISNELEKEQASEKKKNVAQETVEMKENDGLDIEVIEQIPEDNRPLISYMIKKEATIYSGDPTRYYVLIDKVDLKDNTLTEKVERVIDRIVEEKGAKLDISIFDHSETLEKTYANEVELKFSNDPSALKAIIKLQETHLIADFSGEQKLNTPYLNTLMMFPSASGKLSKTVEYNPTTRNSETAQRQRAENQKKQADLKKEQADFKKNCFSGWDGSHTELVKYVKKNMHNPKSFEHVSTTYATANDYAVVTMTYRGTNALGAIVTEKVKAQVSYDCKVIKIMN